MTTSVFQYTEGQAPLLISMPHNGTLIPEDIAVGMTDIGLTVPDTDWCIDRLYDFADELGAYVIKPVYNRLVIDLNRDPTGVNLYPGAQSTELCPTTCFDFSPVYKSTLLIIKLLLTFKRPPSSDLSHDLTIKIALSNGAVFEEELMDIEISH